MRGLIDRIVAGAVTWHAGRTYRRFVQALNRASAAQEDVLLRQVRLNADSDFGREHHFGRIRTYRDFVANVPIRGYELFQPYVERLKRGQWGALLGSRQRLLMFALTSGTTAEPKFIPVTRRFLREYRRGWTIFGVKMFSDHREAVLRPILQVTSPMDEFRTEAGTPCGAITGLMAASQRRLVRRYYVCPLCVAYIPDSLAKYYTIMRLAIPQDVAFLITANPATHLRLAEVANEHREVLIRDVWDGTLTRQMPVPDRIRDELAGRLRPLPDVARRLETLAGRAGALLPKDTWRLSFLANWTGGTLGLYRQQLARYFGDVPVRDIGLMASEGRMSIPLQDDSPAGVLDFQNSFFEFLPAEQIDSRQPQVLRSGELEVGRQYVVLLTTASGLYRYDIRDVVRVVDYLGQAPVIEFLHKGAHISSMTGEKLTERQVVEAAERLAKHLGLRMETFVLAPRWSDPPFYLLHLEAGALPAGLGATQVCAELDQLLSETNIEYRSKRHTHRLGPVRLNLLPDGYLAELDHGLAQRRGRAEQFKHRFLYTRPGEDAGFLSLNAAGPASAQG